MEGDDPNSAHVQWMDSWEKKYITDEAVLTALATQVRQQKIRIATRRGSSDDHPDEVVTVEGMVLGKGHDTLWAEMGPRKIVRVSLVLDNGHAYHIRPGMKIEVRAKSDHQDGWREVANFPEAEVADPPET